MTLPETSRSVMPEPGSSAATIIASSRLAGAARRAGSASRRLRAAATKPSIAALTLSTLASSSRSARVRYQRQVRKRREQAAEHRREDLVEMALDDVVVGLERVDVRAEGQAGDRVDGEAHQVGLQVYRRAGRGSALPAAFEPVAHPHQRREVGAQVARVEAGHHHPPLPLPGLALGAEDAGAEADLAGDARRSAACAGSLRAGRAGSRPSPCGRRSPAAGGRRSRS